MDLDRSPSGIGISLGHHDGISRKVPVSDGSAVEVEVATLSRHLLEKVDHLAVGDSASDPPSRPTARSASRLT